MRLTLARSIILATRHLLLLVNCRHRVVCRRAAAASADATDTCTQLEHRSSPHPSSAREERPPLLKQRHPLRTSLDFGLVVADDEAQRARPPPLQSNPLVGSSHRRNRRTCFAHACPVAAAAIARASVGHEAALTN